MLHSFELKNTDAPLSVFPKYFFWLSNLEHFKKTKQFAIPKAKLDVKNNSKNNNILDFPKDNKS